MGGPLMAEVITVPVLGKVKQSWLYAGGAAVAGIVGYAWWSGAGTGEDEETFDVELPATDYEPPTVLDSGLSVGGAAQGEPIARTNVEWRSMAAEQGAALGFSDAVLNSALTKYLGKDRLNVTEAAAMAAIVAILGQPPSGGPYPILAELPTPAPSALPAPVLTARYLGPGSTATNAKMRVSWPPVTGAVSYQFHHVGGSTGTITNTYFDTIAPRSPGSSRWEIQARSAQGQLGAIGSITVSGPRAGTVPAPTPGTSTRIPANPASLGLLPLGGARYGLAFPPVAGATRYRYRWETANRSSAWATAPSRAFNVVWRFSVPGTQFRARVQAGNAAGWSQGRLSNIVRSR
jgi:hypothetical protein